jgi:hypothetical protein
MDYSKPWIFAFLYPFKETHESFQPINFPSARRGMFGLREEQRFPLVEFTLRKPRETREYGDLRIEETDRYRDSKKKLVEFIKKVK